MKVLDLDRVRYSGGGFLPRRSTLERHRTQKV